MKYILIFTLFLFFHCTTLAQGTIKISGSVKDMQTKQLLPYVNIGIKETNIGTSSDIFGNYTLQVPNDVIPIEITVSHLGYISQSFTINNRYDSKIDISLDPTSFELENILVKYNKNKIFGNKINVLDYKVIDGGFLIIAYKKFIFKASLIMLNKEGLIIYEIPILGTPIMLYEDCIEDDYLICQEKPYKLNITKDTTIITNTSQNQFNKLMQPCVAKSSKHLFYRQDFPEDYMIKYWSKNIYSDTMKSLTEIQGNKKNYYKTNMPVPASLFCINDTIIVFDNLNKKIISFNFNNFDIIKEVNYDNHLFEENNFRVIKDGHKNEHYAVFYSNTKNIKIFHIETNTGELENETVIPFSNVEKLSIANDTIYFLYRVKKSKHLYFYSLN